MHTLIPLDEYAIILLMNSCLFIIIGYCKHCLGKLAYMYTGLFPQDTFSELESPGQEWQLSVEAGGIGL